MMNDNIKFFVKHEDGRGFTCYYRKSGRCFCWSRNYDKRRDLLIDSPALRISNDAFNFSLSDAIAKGVEIIRGA